METTIRVMLAKLEKCIEEEQAMYNKEAVCAYYKAACIIRECAMTGNEIDVSNHPIFDD